MRHDRDLPRFLGIRLSGLCEEVDDISKHIWGLFLALSADCDLNGFLRSLNITERDFSFGSVIWAW